MSEAAKKALDEAVSKKLEDVAEEVKNHEETCEVLDLENVSGGWKIAVSYDTASLEPERTES